MLNCTSGRYAQRNGTRCTLCPVAFVAAVNLYLKYISIIIGRRAERSPLMLAHAHTSTLPRTMGASHACAAAAAAAPALVQFTFTRDTRARASPGTQIRVIY